MADIKRSMSVRPCPIDITGPRPKHPEYMHPHWERNTAGHRTDNWTGAWGYIITRVTNSTQYRPGFLLTKKQVDDLIESEWTVSVLSRV